jgi:protein-tyrosine phosphatase
VADELRDGQTVGVHCRQGIGRSGLMAIGALMASGVDAGKAIEIANIARGLPVPETEGQLLWVQRLAEEQRILHPLQHVTLHT